ncbi:tRNA-ribosyltransferase [Paramixta manurensis]|uniref:tRNA-ribosyltransferase n=1 Tax=Paramixta manurensis TaxID=2740817 RepID=A0A6M8U4Q9_9GAMM|nr:tRNA-ribosyltransferase [Erwiniaceae bacterium PD-1]
MVIETYTPEFVLRMQAQGSGCACQHCQTEAALTELRWQNHIRHSAQLACDSVARAMLFTPEAFILHRTDSPVSSAGEALCEQQQVMNQCCINLLIAPQLRVTEKLYACGVFLSKAQKMIAAGADDAALIDSCQQLLEMAVQGSLQPQFASLPPIEKYKLAQLRQLSERPLDAALDPLTGMALVLKLNELKILSDDYLAETLQQIDGDEEATAFLEQHPSVWLNYFLYRCYHDVFPGSDSAAYATVFLSWCEDYFSLKALCSLLCQSYCELDEETLAAVFAAWQRARTGQVSTVSEVDRLLIGLSLLS